MGYLPWIRNALLTVHTTVAITTATIFLFQMATLVTSINAYFEDSITQGKNVHTEHKQKGSRGESQVRGELESDTKVLRVPFLQTGQTQENRPSQEWQKAYN